VEKLCRRRGAGRQWLRQDGRRRRLFSRLAVEFNVTFATIDDEHRSGNGAHQPI
jgi:hypothetical protein